MDGGSRHCTRGSDQDHSQEKEMLKGKMVVWEGLTNSWEKKRSQRQRRKGKIYQLNAEYQRTARRDKKAFLSDQCKEIEENNRMGKTRELFGKIDTKGSFHASSVQSLSHIWLFNPMDFSTPGFPIHHQLLELTQTHVHLVSDASNHLFLCCALLLLPSIFPSIMQWWAQ